MDSLDETWRTIHRMKERLTSAYIINGHGILRASRNSRASEFIEEENENVNGNGKRHTKREG